MGFTSSAGTGYGVIVTQPEEYEFEGDLYELFPWNGPSLLDTALFGVDEYLGKIVAVKSTLTTVDYGAQPRSLAKPTVDELAELLSFRTEHGVTATPQWLVWSLYF